MVPARFSADSVPARFSAILSSKLGHVPLCTGTFVSDVSGTAVSARSLLRAHAVVYGQV